MKLKVSPSPHIHSGDSVSSNMYAVVYALLPALLVSLYYFGLGALVVTLTSVLACVFFEYILQRYLLKVKTSITDGSAMLTGLLLAFNLPSNLPLWIVVIGAFVSIAVAKISFGGLGNNIFNPALVGRVFLLISFPVQMTTWPVASDANRFVSLDGVTGATPLAILKGVEPGDLNYLDMALGHIGGSLGEVSAIALLLGMVFLIVKRVIRWYIPITIFGTVAALTFLLGRDPMAHFLSGGLILGAAFMATDYVTSPMSKKGMIIFGVGVGVLTVIIRLYGAYPEGMSFAILIMNAVTPLINSYCKPKRFGEIVSHG